MFACRHDPALGPVSPARPAHAHPLRAVLSLFGWLGLCASSHAFDTAQLVGAARSQTLNPVVYDGSYRRIGYPGGDVPSGIGVCTDVVIRAYRAQGIDLQQNVHEDMRTAFAAYPALWGLSRPDPNIDHRRVPNLQRYLSRHGTELAVPSPGRLDDLEPGDLVTWMLPGNLPHIGIVSDRRAAGGRHPLILHNIGAGVVEDDILFAFPITGHYRYPVKLPAADGNSGTPPETN